MQVDHEIDYLLKNSLESKSSTESAVKLLNLSLNVCFIEEERKQEHAFFSLMYVLSKVRNLLCQEAAFGRLSICLARDRARGGLRGL